MCLVYVQTKINDESRLTETIRLSRQVLDTIHNVLKSLGVRGVSNQCAGTNSLFHETSFFFYRASCSILFGVFDQFLSFVLPSFTDRKGKVMFSHLSICLCPEEWSGSPPPWREAPWKEHGSREGVTSRTP